MNESNSVGDGTAVDGVLGLRMLPGAMLLGAVGASGDSGLLAFLAALEALFWLGCWSGLIALFTQEVWYSAESRLIM